MRGAVAPNWSTITPFRWIVYSKGPKTIESWILIPSRRFQPIADEVVGRDPRAEFCYGCLTIEQVGGLDTKREHFLNYTRAQ